MKFYLMLALSLMIYTLLLLFLISKVKKPNGILHIDKYINKDAWWFEILDPIDEFKDKRRVIFEIREIVHKEEFPEGLDD